MRLEFMEQVEEPRADRLRRWPVPLCRRPARQRRPHHLISDRLGIAMKVHLVDGTYELFRHFFGAPPHPNADGQEVAAVRGVVSSVLQLLAEGATHVGVATTTSLSPSATTCGLDTRRARASIPICGPRPGPLSRRSLRSVSCVADGRARGGRRPGERCRRRRRRPGGGAGHHLHSRQDLGQCVRGTRIVQLDRRKDVLIDEGNFLRSRMTRTKMTGLITPTNCRGRWRRQYFWTRFRQPLGFRHNWNILRPQAMAIRRSARTRWKWFRTCVRRYLWTLTTVPCGAHFPPVIRSRICWKLRT